MVEIYGAGIAVVLMWVRYMGQEQLWGCLGSDLWGRSCYGADVGQIYGAGAAVEVLCVRSMGQEMLWGTYG